MPGYRVYRADRDQFGDGVMLSVKCNVRHEQFLLLDMVVNLDTIAVCLCSQNILLFVSFTTHPTSLFCTLTLILFFSSFKIVRRAILLFVLEHVLHTLQ
jgi:hypothetical protein